MVVDDEAVARRRIARLLAERDDIELVGEASGGQAALEAIERLMPDLVFLDVQMPDLDGFQVLQHLDVGHLPAIIFVTAYDQYAVKAFEASAVDYLLKPYDSDRFNQAVDRAAQWIAPGGHSAEEDRLRRLLNEVLGSGGGRVAREGGGTLDRFMTKEAGRAYFVRSADVDWIQAEGNYVRLHVGQSTHLVRGTIAACAERLDPRKFVRIHRRYIVNMERVKEIQPWFGGDYVMILTTGQKLRLSRSFREQFRRRMLGE